VKLAFVIVTYQGERYVRPLLATLRANTDLRDAGVIVVDNASTDGTMAALREIERTWDSGGSGGGDPPGAPSEGGNANASGRLRILPQERNTGFAGGCNAGIAEARRLGAAYVMLLNQDLELGPGWLPPLVAVMDARAEVAAAQPVIVLHDDPARLNTGGNAIHFCGFGFCDRYRALAAEVFPDPNEVRSVPYASGAALLLRLDALARAGDFDERLFLYHEDCDLQIRLRQLGYDCVVVAASRVAHKYDASFSAPKLIFLERNRWYVLLKDWPLARLAAAAPALLGTELAVLVMAARGGWLGGKLGSYGEIARALPELLRDRRAVQARRGPAANDGQHLVGAIQFEGFDHPIVTRFANPILSGYWAAARALLRVP
jgi:N-acetylglucosaminyl-diphospho-decaprenol L-rhamnosyltransferase